MKPVVKAAIEKSKVVTSMFFTKRVADFRRMSEEEFWLYQQERFLQIYGDARYHVPYYKARGDVYPGHLDSTLGVLETLAKLPVLLKSEVRKDSSQFWRQPPHFLTREHTTGGTTGTPLRVRASLFERGFTEAILRDRNQAISGTRTPRILRLSGFHHRSADDDIFLQIPWTKYAYLSIYDLKRERASEISQILEDFQPQVLHGYASTLYQLSLLFSDAPLKNSRKLAIVSTSETLFEYQRDQIETSLDAHVYNEYGSQEGQHLVLECSQRSLHIHPGRGVVEILKIDRDEPADRGELGRVVVTGLAKTSMPLIRYDIGDSAVSTGFECRCACGLAWPTIGLVHGRTEDLVRTRDGRRIGLLSHSTLKDWDGIAESQIVQLDFERFKYVIVPADSSSMDRQGLENHVRTQLRHRLGTVVHVEFEYVDAVPRTALGKIQAVVVDSSFSDR